MPRRGRLAIPDEKRERWPDLMETYNLKTIAALAGGAEPFSHLKTPRSDAEVSYIGVSFRARKRPPADGSSSAATLEPTITSGEQLYLCHHELDLINIFALGFLKIALDIASGFHI